MSNSQVPRTIEQRATSLSSVVDLDVRYIAHNTLAMKAPLYTHFATDRSSLDRLRLLTRVNNVNNKSDMPIAQ